MLFDLSSQRLQHWVQIELWLSGSVTHPLDNYWTYTSQHRSAFNLHQPKCVNSPKIISLSEGVIEMSSAPLKKAVP